MFAPGERGVKQDRAGLCQSRRSGWKCWERRSRADGGFGPRHILCHAELQSPAAEVHDMGMVATRGKWTAEMLRALPDDGKRYEIVHGELLVTPSPSFTHQRAVRALLGLIDAYLQTGRRAEVLSSPADIELQADSIVQPDLFVFPTVGRKPLRDWSDIGPLLLAIEVLSPSTARYDRIVKRRLYLEQQIPEYWIVDCDARCIERWRPGDERPEILTERIEWRSPGPSSPLTIDLAVFFATVLEGEAE